MPPRTLEAARQHGSDEDTPLLEVKVDSVEKAHIATSEEHWHVRVLQEMMVQSKTALPTLQSMVFTKIPWLISLRFVGGIGAPELAAAALATTLCNVTGMALSVGLSSALSTLSGQAKGELLSRMLHEKQRRVSFDMGQEVSLSHESKTLLPVNTKEPITTIIFFWRGMVIQLCIIVPVAIWWLSGVESTLLQLGQTPLLSTMTQDYLRVLVPGLLGYSIGWTLTSWLQSIGMADVPAKASVLGLLLHLPFNWLFVYVLDWGYLGCGAATVCFYVLQPIFMISYLCLYDHGRHRLLESSGGTAIGRTALSFTREFWLAISSWRGYTQYLSLALPGIIIISEWVASETIIFLSGRLLPDPEIALGGMTIYQSINSFCFMFPLAFAISASARVGNLLGAGEPVGAAFAANVSVLSAGAISMMIGLLLFVVPRTFLPSLFAPGAEGVILETSRTMPLLAIYVFADGIQAALSGIIKGCGRQLVTVPIVVVAYWAIGVPLAYYIAFVRHEQEMFCEDSYFCGDVGLVAGMTAGTWVHMILLAIVVGLSTDWKEESRKAKTRVAETNR